MKEKSTIGIRDGGFTIVETLIVLAIAGLILMMVFEAIPALQRSGRNNQRRSDVSIILESVSHYELNDSGNFPLPCGGGSGFPSCTATAGGASPNDYFLRFNAGRLTYYIANGIVLRSISASTTVGAVPTLDQVYVYNYQKCKTDGSGQSTPQGAGYNDVVALFAIETGNGTSRQCEQL
jgi:prepilin-type N-terminal cleavage/methylation domain-containing protein